MIESALLLWQPSREPLRVVAGLPAILRQLFSLQDQGISQVFLLNAPEGAVPADHRLWLELHYETPATIEAPCLVAPAGIIWHSGLPSALLEATIADKDEVFGFAQDDAWVCVAGAEGARELLSHQNPSLFGKAPPAPLFLCNANDPGALDSLLSSLRKPLDGLIARALNRYVSLWVTKRLINTRLTPNQMTLIAAVFGVLAVWFGGAADFIWAGVCIQMQSILDGCDGEIARLKYLRSRSGEWLDSICDDVLNLGVFVGVGVGLQSAGAGWVAWPLWIATGALVLYDFTLYYALLHGPTRSGNPFLFQWWFQERPSASYVAPKGALGGVVGAVSDFLQQASRRDFILFFYFATALVGHIEAAFVWHAFCSSVAGVTSMLQWVIAGPPRAAARVSGA